MANASSSLTTNNEQLIALSKLLQTLRESNDLDRLTEAMVNHLQDHFDYRMVWIGLYDRVKHQLKGQGGISSLEDKSFLRKTFAINSGDVMEQVIIEQLPIGIPDLRQEKRAGQWAEMALNHNVQGSLILPLSFKRQCFGVIVLSSHLWGVSPHEEEKAHLATITGSFASTLYDLDVESKHEKIIRPAKSVFHVLKQIYQKPSLDARLEKIIETTHELLGPDSTDIYWYSPEKRVLWHRVSHNPKNIKKMAEGINVSEFPDFYQALSQGDTIQIGSGPGQGRLKNQERLLQLFQCKSLLLAPVNLGQDVLGFIMGRDKKLRTWESTEKQYLTSMGQMITMVIGNEDMEAKMRRADQLRTIQRSLQEIFHQDLSWQLIMDQCSQFIQKHLGADHLIILQPPHSRGKAIADYTVVYESRDSHRELTEELPVLDHQTWEKLLGNIIPYYPSKI